MISPVVNFIPCLHLLLTGWIPQGVSPRPLGSPRGLLCGNMGLNRGLQDREGSRPASAIIMRSSTAPLSAISLFHGFGCPPPTAARSR